MLGFFDFPLVMLLPAKGVIIAKYGKEFEENFAWSVAAKTIVPRIRFVFRCTILRPLEPVG